MGTKRWNLPPETGGLTDLPSVVILTNVAHVRLLQPATTWCVSQTSARRNTSLTYKHTVATRGHRTFYRA